MSDSVYQNILTRQDGRVGVVQINRPKALNALNTPTMAEIMDALATFDVDDGVGCMVLTGNERAFAAGADIKQMATASVAEMLNTPFIDLWDRLKAIRKPV
ncbi:MAG: enoyl-CoA hydratase, partial [Chloroflexi bacterium]